MQKQPARAFIAGAGFLIALRRGRRISVAVGGSRFFGDIPTSLTSLARIVGHSFAVARAGALSVFAHLRQLFVALKGLCVEVGYSGEDFARSLTERSPKTVVKVVNRKLGTNNFQMLPPAPSRAHSDPHPTTAAC